MSSSLSPASLLRDEAQTTADCQGCGAPLTHDASKCAYCGRETPLATRKLRMERMTTQKLPGYWNEYQRPGPTKFPRD